MTQAAAAFSAAPAAPVAAPAASAAPAGAPAAPAPPAAPAAPASAPAASNSEWYGTFSNAEVRDWTKAKGFPNAEQVAESAYNLEKLIGHEKAGRTLVVPKDDASPEEVKAFHSKLGVPDSPDGYTLPLPADADPALVKTMQGWMHEAGVPPKSAAKLTEAFVKFSTEQQVQQDKAQLASSDKAFAEVTARWGKDADANIELGKRFAAQLLPAEVALDNGEKIGRADFLAKLFKSTGATGAVMELFAKAGAGLGEHKMHSNGGGGMGGVDSPAAAQARIKALQSDKAWSAAYLNGDKDKKAEFGALFKVAYPSGQ
jgi:hypothetical protein